MKRIPFFKYSPCGNITIFLEAPLTPAERLAACAEVIRTDHLAAEQAGVISTDGPLPRLDMIGGEFCLNATRSFAALLAERGLLILHDGSFTGQVSSSGMTEPLDVRVEKKGEAKFDASVKIPLAGSRIERADAGIWLAYLPGIAHVVLDEGLYPLPAGDLSALNKEAALWRARFGLENEPAAGVVRLRPVEQKAGRYAITPHVWVRDTDTACMETSCGSGTLAAALSQGTEVFFTIRQPGGAWLTVQLMAEAKRAAWVGGSVRLLAKGDVFVESL